MAASKRRYYEANPNAIRNKHLLALHEALHAAVAELLGFTWTKIVLKKRTGFINWEPKSRILDWKNAAVESAPALIDDMSEGDAGLIRRYKPRTRGYAWSWLCRHREAILERANTIAAATSGLGTLWNRDGVLMWKPKLVGKK